MSLTVGIPKETFPGERRVAMTPSAFDRLAKSGMKLVVEQGAGEEAPANRRVASDCGLVAAQPAG